MTEMKPRYSLVVMTRNRPGPLARCLESLARLRWSGPAPEIIVVDDGSEPSARPVVDRFSSLNPVYVRQENRGVSGARNRGIDTATGAFIGFIADDYVLPESYLADVDDFFRKHADAQVISHSVDPRGANVLRAVQRLYFDLALRQEIAPADAGKDIASSLTLPASRAAVFRREIFETVGRFDENIQVGEDGEFGRRLGRAGIPVYIFLRKRVIHHDARSSLDYLRQRIRYGRSYLRAGIAGPTRQAFEKRGGAVVVPAMVERLRRKVEQWWDVSGASGMRVRFVLLCPFLLLFLFFFYLGAFLELKETRRAARKGP